MNESFSSIADHVISLARQRGADEAEVIISGGRDFSATVRLGEVERVTEAQTRTLGLRLFKDGRVAGRSTTDFTPRGLETFVDRTLDILQIADRDPHAALPEWEEQPDPLELGLYDPAVEALPAEEKIARALRAEAAGRDLDPRITNSGGATFGTTLREFVLHNSRGFGGSYRSSMASLSVQLIADDEEQKKRTDYWASYERRLDALQDPETVGRIAAERTLGQLGARKAQTRAVPVVFDPFMAMSLLHLIGQAASGEQLHKRATFLLESKGKSVASPLVSLTDDPLLVGRLGSRPFDDEGIASRRNPLLVEGVFQGFLFDTYYGRLTGNRSTGSSSRALGGAPSVGTSNLVLAPGAHSPEEIIASVEDGLYLMSTMGTGVNLTTGTFSRGAAGVWIEKGKLSYPVAEINISSTLQEMLQGISMLGTDLTWRGGTAAPTLKIDRMMVSGL